MIFFKRAVSFIWFLLFIGINALSAQQVDYSVVSVPEESGIDLKQITAESDYVCMPTVRRSRNNIDWISNRILDISPNGEDIAYLSFRNNSRNIFIKSLGKQGSSIQRTNRQNVMDFSYSPDGNHICFSEERGKSNQIFVTSAIKGYVCRQITSGNLDFSPIYSLDMKQIFFTRQEMKGVGIWSYNIGDNFLSSLTSGMNPCPYYKHNVLFCTRVNTDGRGEIWRIDYESGIEECVISDPVKSFTSPLVSPDGKWILFVGSSRIEYGKISYLNTDIYVARIDGTDINQLTYHAADDLSPIWSKDGKFIYFISQRGSATGTANIWRMTFDNLSFSSTINN